MLARVDDRLLFLPTADPDLVDAFVSANDAASARHAVTSAVTRPSAGRDAGDGGVERPSFVLVTWSAGLDLTVFGDLEVSSDLPSAPGLSGARSGTWVDHHVAVLPDGARVWAGAPPMAGTNLTAGVVPASGFALHLITTSTRTAPAPVHANEPAALDPPSVASRIEDAAAPPAPGAPAPIGGAVDLPVTAPEAQPAAEPPPQHTTPASTTDDQEPAAAPDAADDERMSEFARRLAALDQAAGGDWMEGTLGLTDLPSRKSPDDSAARETRPAAPPQSPEPARRSPPQSEPQNEAARQASPDVPDPQAVVDQAFEETVIPTRQATTDAPATPDEQSAPDDDVSADDEDTESDATAPMPPDDDWPDRSRPR